MEMQIAKAKPAANLPEPCLSFGQLAELRRTWEYVVPLGDEAAQLFYARLFELDPSLRPLFHADHSDQRQKLLEALALIVACAGRPNDCRPVLAALGERHLTYGVRLDHYVTAGAALLWTLDEGLGLLETQEARDAWSMTYEFVVTAMCGG